MALPPYVPWKLVAQRLPVIFPEGTPHRLYCIRELAAKTVFTALYIGAVEGTGQLLGPFHVYRMTDEQSTEAGDLARAAYARAVLKSEIPGKRWYKDNTREPIRDETLRDGLVAVGAVIRREDLATTSSAPRYALKAEFAGLFDPALEGKELEEAIIAYQAAHLSKSALTRVTIMRAGAGAAAGGVLVTFPNGETRRLAPGPSSVISKGVIEVFAKNFLTQPGVLWLSESGNKVVVRDESIAKAIGLNIEADKNLPDLILVDLAEKDPLIVFVEVVATDGAVTQRRRDAIFCVTDTAGFNRNQIAFLTAYQDRGSAGFKKTVANLSWGTFAWFASEPEHIVMLTDGGKSIRPLAALLSSK